MTTTRYKSYTDVNPSHWYWPNFTPKEIACRQYHPTKGMCGCGGSLIVNHKAMDALQSFRTIIGVPFTPNSACRCQKHNRNWGGAPSSKHLEGIAFDIPILPGMSRDLIKETARQVGFTGIGDYDTFNHVDTRDNPAYWDLRSKK